MVQVILATPIPEYEISLFWFQTFLSLSAQPNIALKTLVDPGTHDLMRSRNEAAHRALVEQADALLFFDSDQSASGAELAEMVHTAIALDAPVGAPIRKKCNEVMWNFCPVNHEAAHEGVVMAERVGTGAMAIPRTVLERLTDSAEWWRTVENQARHAFFKNGLDANGFAYLEDDGFCRLCHRAGQPIYVDFRCRVTHYGLGVFAP